MDLDDSLNMMMKEAEKHEASLHLCQNLVKEETLLSKVIEVKIEVVCAWLTLKWSKIVLALSESSEIERTLEEEFIRSIRETMEPVEHIIRNHSSMGVRDLQQYGERVLAKKEVLKKNKNVWLEAYEVRTSPC